jgi:hypothetical protein
MLMLFGGEELRAQTFGAQQAETHVIETLAHCCVKQIQNCEDRVLRISRSY